MVALFDSERDRWIIWSPVLMGLGVALYFGLPEEPSLWTGALTFVAATGLCIVLRRSPVMARSVTILALIAAGFLAAELRTAMVAAPVLTQQIGPTYVHGKVALVEQLETGTRVLVDAERINRLPRSQTPERVRVRMTKYSDAPRVGQDIELLAILYAPPAPAAPGAYDFRRDLYFQRIGGVGYSVKRFEQEATANDDAPLIGRMRQAAAQRISAVLDGPDKAAERSIALALLVGERGPIPETVNSQMRDSGLAHLLAISGMNVTIAAGLIYFVLRFALAAIPWVALRFPIKKWAAAGGLLSAIAYTQFVGAPVSAERAMITTAVLMFAIMLDRNALSMRVAAFSAVLLLLVEPEALMGASFQMSYAAILALVVLFEFWQYRGGKREHGRFRRAMLYLGAIAVMSVAASAATAVFAIYHFQQNAFYGLGANLIAVPLNDLWIMPWAVAAYALMPLGLEALALVPMSWGISAMLATAKFFADLPGAAAQYEAMPSLALGLIVLGGLWFLIWTKRWRWLGVAPVTAGIFVALSAQQPDIQISDNGKLVAIRRDSGEIAFSNRRSARFVQSVWFRRAGQGDIKTGAPQVFGKTSDGRNCPKDLCRFSVAGRTGAIVSDPNKLAEACADSDVVIAQISAHAQCDAKLVIDSDDLAREGATSVFFEDGDTRVATVRDVTGDRPWTQGGLNTSE